MLLAMLLSAQAADGLRACRYDRHGALLPGWALTPAAGWLFSVANDNQRYWLVVELALLPESWACLSLGGSLLGAASIGQDGTNSTATFALSPGQAAQVAALLSLPMRDRVRLDEGISAHFAVPESWRVGGEMPLTLVLRNQGAAAVAVTLGGRDRGTGRDNRFHFTAAQDGQALPGIGSALDTGGLTTIAVLSPGEELRISADVSRWTTLPAPGTYTLRCSFALELSVPRQGFSVEHAHERWDVAVEEELTVTVR